MHYKKVLITGGAGFVGSSIALKLRQHYPNISITVFDNLKRRGSELNLPRLQEHTIDFFHGDIRNKEDFGAISSVDLILECSAEPSVLAGVNESPDYLINTNLMGTINCLELARRHQADILFFSTSRVYPIDELNNLEYTEGTTRFQLKNKQKVDGVSAKGISENFPLGKSRSLYGATKLASELILQEYMQTYHIKGVINRCGVITGPWQMGKIDQGVIVLWLARHFFNNKPLSYIGYGGTGKQVRDLIDIDDLFDAILIQLNDIEKYNGETFNIGGGVKNSLSLLEMTQLCEKVTGNKIEIESIKENRANDIPIYLSDCSKFHAVSNWTCKKTVEQTFEEIYAWIVENQEQLLRILG